VDDCEGLHAAFKLVLRKGANVQTAGAATSGEALKLARRRSFDAVISDIVRPGIDGLEFLRIFKQMRPRVPVVIVSGILDETTAGRAKWLRAFECLPKPFSGPELVAVVRAAIASRKVQDAAAEFPPPPPLFSGLGNESEQLPHVHVQRLGKFLQSGDGRAVHAARGTWQSHRRFPEQPTWEPETS
jgi:DNA-binding NtrC family response regulator